MHEPLSYTAALLFGVLSSSHCVGMCGGIMGALSFAVPPEKRVPKYILPILLFYNFGRILSYTTAGAIVGGLSWLLVDQYHEAIILMRVISGAMLIAMGLYIANLSQILRIIENYGLGLWAWIQKPLKTMLPISHPIQAVFVGMLWGWVPCGLVYSTLVWAASTSNGYQSAIIMLCFGLGTLPAVIATGFFAPAVKRFYQSKYNQVISGIFIILFGIWTIIYPLIGNQHH